MVILTCSLREQFSTKSAKTADKTLQQPCDNRTERAFRPENERKTPRDFVRSIYPLAYCKSKNGRKGPYLVYVSRQSQVEIAKAKGTAAAWQKAAKKLKSGTFLPEQSTHYHTGAPKVYAIKT